MNVTVKQIQRLDKIAIEKYGIPSIVLMENAGKATAEIIIKKLKGKKSPRVTVVCGLGNNAGDGFVVARHLMEAKIKTKTWIIGQPKKLKADAAINYRVLKKLHGNIQVIQNNRFSDDIKKADIVVDALFGVGLSKEVGSPFQEVIQKINALAKNVVSVDVPSGLDATTGKILGVCVKANTTVTFSFAKQGFCKDEGKRYAGKVIVVEIGIPEKVKKSVIRGLRQGNKLQA